MVMVKPALPYLDVLTRVADAVDVPVVAYQISGEYSMVEAAAAQGWINREAAILETLTSIHRAGADDPDLLGRRGRRPPAPALLSSTDMGTSPARTCPHTQIIFIFAVWRRQCGNRPSGS